MLTAEKHAYPVGARRFTIELPAILVTLEYATGLVISTELVIRPPCKYNDQTKSEEWVTEIINLKVKYTIKISFKLAET